MTEPKPSDALAGHLEHLAADADDVFAMLSVHHADGGDIHPEALPKAERLHVSLKAVIQALSDLIGHEPLAMSADDIWAALTVEHKDHESGIS